MRIQFTANVYIQLCKLYTLKNFQHDIRKLEGRLIYFAIPICFSLAKTQRKCFAPVRTFFPLSMTTDERIFSALYFIHSIILIWKIPTLSTICKTLTFLIYLLSFKLALKLMCCYFCGIDNRE